MIDDSRPPHAGIGIGRIAPASSRISPRPVAWSPTAS